MSREEELDELIVYISGMRRAFQRKVDDHTFIIDQQRDRIEYQQHLIDDQRMVIDELAWQLRDLRDSVRQCCEKIAEFSAEKCRDRDQDRNQNQNRNYLAEQRIRGRLERQDHIEGDKLYYLLKISKIPKWFIAIVSWFMA